MFKILTIVINFTYFTKFGYFTKLSTPKLSLSHLELFPDLLLPLLII